MSKKRVYGLQFEEPSCEFEDLIEDSVFDGMPSILTLAISIIPLIGFAGIIASLIFAIDEKDDNRFGIAEIAWRSAVYGLVIQLISLTAFVVIIL